MSVFSKRIRELRESLGMNKSVFSVFVETNVANITRYENEDMGVSMEAIEKIAEKTGVNPGWLIGWCDEKYPCAVLSSRPIPIVGVIAAGVPILAQENIESEFPLPIYLARKGEIFMLRVEGDSMINAGILDGDYVIVARQQVANNGEIVAAMIEDEATVKRFYNEGTHIRLQAENEFYEPIISTEVVILGRVIGVYRLLW